MNSRLEQLISSALLSGEPTFHEALPEDFGSDGARWTLFADCLIALLNAHPALSISLAGSYSTLDKFGLEAASIKKLGRYRVTVWPGPTERPGAIRLSFSPKHSPIVVRSKLPTLDDRKSTGPRLDTMGARRSPAFHVAPVSSRRA
jgi:hypothetical protein